MSPSAVPLIRPRGPEGSWELRLQEEDTSSPPESPAAGAWGPSSGQEGGDLGGVLQWAGLGLECAYSLPMVLFFQQSAQQT